MDFKFLATVMTSLVVGGVIGLPNVLISLAGVALVYVSLVKPRRVV